MRIILTGLFGLTLSASVMANSLYRVDVPLADTDSQSEQAARVQGFEQVLQRVTGDAAILKNPLIEKAVGTPDDYISQFSFDSQGGQRVIELGFDKEQLLSLLTDAQAELWPEPRVKVLVWLVEEQNGRRTIVWDQSRLPQVEDIKLTAQRHGLPVILPVGDFDDQMAVTVPDLWGGFTQSIGKASERYQPDAVVVAKWRRGSQTVDWVLYPISPAAIQSPNPKTEQGDADGIHAVAKMVDELAAYFADRDAIQLGVVGDQGQQIIIDDIASFEDLVVIERALRALPSVAAVNLDRMTGRQAIYNLSLTTSLETFEKEWLALPTVEKRGEIVPLEAVAPVTEAVSAAQAALPVPTADAGASDAIAANTTASDMSASGAASTVESAAQTADASKVPSDEAAPSKDATSGEDTPASLPIYHWVKPQAAPEAADGSVDATQANEAGESASDESSVDDSTVEKSAGDEGASNEAPAASDSTSMIDTSADDSLLL
uniref:DUF2066 domain-containing protein n=1 Tax=Thaumasiovibrio occultus TaxID=1891184 RepID=UPI000B34BAB4|nr:DUF2066 domain-containing protein [Thaumasiovibrio occultus]